MGGVAVDLDCRVLDKSGKAVPSLYAVGEVTGFGGINGKAALEGTFLGPAVFMGRIAGRNVAAQAKAPPRVMREVPAAPATRGSAASTSTFDDGRCLGCHDVAKGVVAGRAGYWHYENSRRKVLARAYACSSYHRDLFPYRPRTHRLDRTAIVTACRTCHGVQGRETQTKPATE